MSMQVPAESHARRNPHRADHTPRADMLDAARRVIQFHAQSTQSRLGRLAAQLSAGAPRGGSGEKATS